MDKNYFPNFCGSPCLSFVHLSRTEGVFTAHQVEFSNKNGKIRAFWNVRNSVIVLFLFFVFLGVFRIMGSHEQRSIWSGTMPLPLCRISLVCPASDQVSISKSGFQTASPPFFFRFVFSLHVLRTRHFVSLLGTVTCGVHSVLFAGGNVRGDYCHSQSE